MIKNLIREILIKKFDVPNIKNSLDRLKDNGFNPEVIYDVGAYKGEFTLLCSKIFPNSDIYCFEVLDHALNEIEALAINNQKIQIFKTLLGSKNCKKVEFNESETASSVLKENNPQNFPVTVRKMNTIDSLLKNENSMKSPDLLKLDVQGYELEVLKGAEDHLNEIEVILTEINLLDIHEDVPLLSEIVMWMKKRGWVVYDICGLTRRPLNKALWQSDLIFVKENSKFRLDKRWNS